LQIAEFGLINPQSEIPNPKFPGTLSREAPPKVIQIINVTPAILGRFDATCNGATFMQQ